MSVSNPFGGRLARPSFGKKGLATNVSYTHVNGFAVAWTGPKYSRGEGGNPAAIVLPDIDAKLTDEERFKAASTIGFSATCFVTDIKITEEEALVRLRFITPTKELDISGHGSIAALGLLVEEGLLEGKTEGTIVTKAGNLSFRVENGEPAEVRADS